MTATAVPQSDEQRRAALARANEARLATARLLRDIRSRPVDEARAYVADLLTSDDPQIQAIAIGRLLRAVPKIGFTNMARILTGAWVRSGDRRVRQLTDRQRHVIANQLRTRPASARPHRAAA